MSSRSRRAAKAVPREEPGLENRLQPLFLALFPPAVLAGLSFLPRVHGNPRLMAAFLVAAGALVALWLLLRSRPSRAERGPLHYDLVPMPVHYVQATMQGCIYVYWGL